MLNQSNSPSSTKPNTPLFLTVIALEILYIYFRTSLSISGSFSEFTIFEQELARSGLRAVFLSGLLLAFWRFKVLPDFVQHPKPTRSTILLVIALLAQAIIWQVHPVEGLSEKLLFAVTTILVAVREELVYRYVVQNFIESHLGISYGAIGAILATSVLFTFFHLGAQPVSAFPQILLASVLLGAIYRQSGKSISLVIVCHFVFDLFYI